MKKKTLKRYSVVQILFMSPNRKYAFFPSFLKDIRRIWILKCSHYSLWFIHAMNWLWLLHFPFFIIIINGRTSDCGKWELGCWRKKVIAFREGAVWKSLWLWESRFLFITGSNWLEQAWLKTGIQEWALRTLLLILKIWHVVTHLFAPSSVIQFYKSLCDIYHATSELLVTLS